MGGFSEVKLLGKVHLPDRQISINDSNGVVPKNKYGLPDNWYGGMCKEFRRIKDSGFLMVMDRKDRIINIAYVEDELTGEEKRSIGIGDVDAEGENVGDNTEAKSENVGAGVETTKNNKKK